jgi:plasmid stabilization system protein ParE
MVGGEGRSPAQSQAPAAALIVTLTKAAKRDVKDAAAWYEAQREGFGAEFLESVDEGVSRIGANPLAYRAVSGNNRRCNLERFPYSLFYKVVDEVVVLACLHGHRAPHLSKERGLGVIEFRNPNP